jgi:Protein kinase domain
MRPSRADSSSSTEPAVPGFRFERLIGRGTTAVVFEATQLSLDRRVAVKLFPKGPGIERRVQRLRWPEHPNVVSLYAAGPCEQGYFIAMQLIHGTTLAERRLGRAGTLRVVRDVGAALDAAHRAGAVHGALSARSILVDRDGRGFLCDFGLGPVDATPESDRADFAALVRDILGREPAAVEESAAAIVRSAEGVLRRKRGWAWAAAAAAAAAALAGALIAIDSGAPLEAPSVLPGAVAIGSTLPTGEIRSVDCSGRAPSGASEPCALIQTRLNGRSVAPRSDGVVRRWEVRGARGDLALEVLRRHGNRLFMVARTPYLPIPDDGLHLLRANLPVRAGDLVGLAVAPGAAIGVRDGVRGAAVARRYGPPDVYAEHFEQGAGPGLDRELLLRAEYVPAAAWRPPGRLTGRAAAAAAAGRELDAIEPDPGVRVAAVAAAGRIAVDLLVRGRRVVRLPIRDADASGRLGSLTTQRVRLGKTIVQLEWRNPHGVVSHDYAVGARSLAPLD